MLGVIGVWTYLRLVLGGVDKVVALTDSFVGQSAHDDGFVYGVEMGEKR